jgi:hypothetical protein
MVTISPGATGPGRKLAALTIPVAVRRGIGLEKTV